MAWHLGSIQAKEWKCREIARQEHGGGKLVSNPDHFIDEVTEELRRDRLFALMRRYGWIAILAVLLIVGGAAFNEWRKARAQAEAEALGDALSAALQLEDPAASAAAFSAIEAEGDARAIVALLAAGKIGDAASLARLAELAADPELSPLYRDLAGLKRAMAGGLSVEEKLALLEPLTRAGSAFRVLAEEQIALAEVESGQNQAAISRLQALLTDNEASGPLRQRATQLIVALGAVPGEAPGAVPEDG